MMLCQTAPSTASAYIHNTTTAQLSTLNVSQNLTPVAISKVFYYIYTSID